MTFKVSVQPPTRIPFPRSNTHAVCSVSRGKEASTAQLLGTDTLETWHSWMKGWMLQCTYWKSQQRCTFFSYEHQESQRSRSKPPPHKPLRPKCANVHSEITRYTCSWIAGMHRPGKRGCPGHD